MKTQQSQIEINKIMYKKEGITGLPWHPVLKTSLSKATVQVQSLLREVRSHMLRGQEHPS